MRVKEHVLHLQVEGCTGREDNDKRTVRLWEKEEVRHKKRHSKIREGEIPKSKGLLPRLLTFTSLLLSVTDGGREDVRDV